MSFDLISIKHQVLLYTSSKVRTTKINKLKNEN